MRKLTRISIFVLLLVSTNVVAQKNYIPASVINQEGDTIIGLINYRNWDKNPETIYFKKTDTAVPTLYSPSELSYFIVGNDIYKSAVVEINISANDYDPISKSPVMIVDTVFLLTELRGYISLYLLKYKDRKEHFYVTENNAELIYLRYMHYIWERNDTIFKKKQELYKGQLTFLLSGCKGIEKKINRTEYNSKSLKKLLSYYECELPEATYVKEQGEPSAKFGLFVGVSISNLKLSAPWNTYIRNSDFKTSTDFTGGIFVEFFQKRNGRRASIYNELMYTTYDATSVYHTQNYYNKSEVVTLNMHYSYIKLNNMFRYRIISKRFILYPGVGISNGIAIKNENKRTIEIQSNNYTDISEGNVIPYTKNYEQGWLFGAGCTYKNFNVEFRYELASGMSDSSGVGSSVNRYFVLLEYRF